MPLSETDWPGRLLLTQHFWGLKLRKERRVRGISRGGYGEVVRESEQPRLLCHLLRILVFKEMTATNQLAIHPTKYQVLCNTYLPKVFRIFTTTPKVGINSTILQAGKVRL